MADDETRDDDERTNDEASDGRHRLEGLFRDAIRRAVERGVEAGVGTFSKADRAVRGVANEVPPPREIAGYVFSQIDETKNTLVRVVAREVHDFLEATDMAGEIQRTLTSLSFEIKTEVRFIPNEAGGIRPSVRARPVVKTRRTNEDQDSDPSASTDGEEDSS